MTTLARQMLVMHRLALCVLAVLAGVGGVAAAEPRWVKASLHAHTRSGTVEDDGTETPAELHRALAARGFELSVHSAHSVFNRGIEAAERFARGAAEEAGLGVPGVVTALGQELTVAPGPRYQRRTVIFGQKAPGNLDHVTLVGGQAFVADGTPVEEACKRVHAGGGVCLVNHPGPGPMMWEEGLWEAHKEVVDGLEVYNGEAYAATGLSFEARYLDATAYRGLGARLAAIGGPDTHGPGWLDRAHARLDRLGVAGKVARLAAVARKDDPRPELAAATWVLAADAKLGSVVAALRARRSVAVFGMEDVRVVAMPGIGEVRRGRDVALSLELSRRVEEITLYREGEAVRTWRDVDAVEWKEPIHGPAAYVFAARDDHGRSRMMTSAVWYSGEQ